MQCHNKRPLLPTNTPPKDGKHLRTSPVEKVLL